METPTGQQDAHLVCHLHVNDILETVEFDEARSNVTYRCTRPLTSKQLITAKRMIIRALKQLPMFSNGEESTFSLPFCHFWLRKPPSEMLRRLLREDGAERAFLEKLDLFQQNPGLLEKYLIGSEVSLEVLDLFLSRLFGSEGLSGVADAKESVESVMGDLGSPRVDEKRGRVCERFTGRGDEHWAVVEELKQQVLDLTRQFSGLQRQLQMQGEVSQVAASIEGRLDEVASACERRVEETDERVAEMGSRVLEAAHDLGELKKELGLRASAEDLAKLAADVSRLKEAEQRLNGQISAVAESERVLREEVLLKIVRIECFDPLLNGIIAHLTRECGGNVHKQGLVKVTASSVCCGQPENVVDLTSNSHFHSKGSPTPSWICFDFNERRVALTSYSIRSRDYGPGYEHPKSWVLEVSNDGSESSWKVVDSRENNSDLNDRLVTRHFALSAPQSGAFRFVRLRQTGKNHCGDDELQLSALELFGALSRV